MKNAKNEIFRRRRKNLSKERENVANIYGLQPTSGAVPGHRIGGMRLSFFITADTHGCAYLL